MAAAIIPRGERYGTTVDPAYHPTTGRLSTVTTAEGVYGYSYFTGNGSGASAGEVSSLTAPGGETLGFEYDGRLPSKTTWSGPVAGIVARSFNDGLYVASETAGGVAVSFGYDNDWLLTSATVAGGASLTMTRDPTVGLGAGLLTGTSLGVVATSQTPTAFAELQEDRATVSGAEIYKNEYLGRDALGRILQKRETIQGAVTTFDYTYTPAGQLDLVKVGGSVVRDYDHDGNGNRTHVNGQLLGSYDAQDRLTAYGSKTFAYTAAGDLASKTDAGKR